METYFYCITLYVIDSTNSELSYFNPNNNTIGIFQLFIEKELVLHLIKPTLQFNKTAIIVAKDNITILDKIIIHLN